MIKLLNCTGDDDDITEEDYEFRLGKPAEVLAQLHPV